MQSHSTEHLAINWEQINIADYLTPDKPKIEAPRSKKTDELPGFPVGKKKTANPGKTQKKYTILSPEEQKKVKQYIMDKFGEQGAEALAVANSENGSFSPDRMSGTSDLGIFQVNQIHWNRFGEENLKDPYKNIDAAHQICLDAMARGRDCLSPWTEYKNGNYQKYLPSTSSGSIIE